jgi:hypothetical protein
VEPAARVGVRPLVVGRVWVDLPPAAAHGGTRQLTGQTASGRGRRFGIKVLSGAGGRGCKADASDANSAGWRGVPSLMQGGCHAPYKVTAGFNEKEARVPPDA